MSTTAVLIDGRPDYLRAEGAPTSLLLAPLGDATLIEKLWRRLSQADVHNLVVTPNFDASDDYQAAIQSRASDAQLVAAGEFNDFVDRQEAADWLLIIDARYCPSQTFDLRGLLRDASGSRVARHLIQMQRSTGGTRERVVFDDQRRVRTIERLYEGVTQVESRGVSLSLVTAAFFRQIERPDLFCLADLRTRLAAQGVPSQDLTPPGATFDLTVEDGLLALNEQSILLTRERGARGDMQELASGIWIGPNCHIAPTARLYGPLILHEGVRVSDRAAVIGPAVLGAGATVEREALVSQSLIGAGARVVCEFPAVHRVLGPGLSSATRPSVGLASPWQLGCQTPRVFHGRAGTHSQRRLRTSDAPLPRGAAGAVKRAADFTAALFGLIVLSPLLLVVAALVKLTSRGPIFFGHEREGHGGRVFRCWKFRTMVDRAHAQQRALYNQNAVDGPQFKMDNDPRITAIGRVLRASNIDELPQLFNVLRGEMSLIGPRPSPFRENQICVPWRNARLSVRPGITGLWQVCRHERAAGDFHQWIYFDILYVRHVSLWLDVRVLLATFLTLGGRWGVPLNWMISSRKLQQADLGAVSAAAARARPADAANNAANDAPAPAAPA